MKAIPPKYKAVSADMLVRMVALSAQTGRQVITPNALNYMVSIKNGAGATLYIPLGNPMEDADVALTIAPGGVAFTDAYGAKCLRGRVTTAGEQHVVTIKRLWVKEDDGAAPKPVRKARVRKPATKPQSGTNPLGVLSDAVFAASTRTTTGKLKVDAFLVKGVIPKGREAMSLLNDNGRLLRWEPKTAGFWRDKPSFRKGDDDTLPFPVVTTAVGYVRKDFLANLEIAEKVASRKLYRGWSTNRWTGEANGSAEYHLDDWSWPEGYKTYLKAGVLPSREFYKFIMGKDLASLPAYNKE